MTANEIKFINLLRQYPDAEKVLEVALSLIVEHLAQSQASVEAFPACSRESV
jgi:hypothetical protein